MDTTLGLSGNASGSGGKGGDKWGGGAAGMGREGGEGSAGGKDKKFGDAPPVFVMPDGYSYLHVKRNGLIFGCATEKNVSPVVVIEVSQETAGDS